MTGCLIWAEGPGSFVAHLLENGRALPSHVTIADLIPDALKQAYAKLSSHPKLHFCLIRDISSSCVWIWS